MIKRKYYTPEMGEFHQGFRYEYKTDEYLGILEATEGEWKQERYDGGCGMDGESERDDVYNLIGDEILRVKYLDREDLEELGWVLHKTETIPEKNLEIDAFLYYNSPGNIFQLTISDEYIKIIAKGKDVKSNSVLFLGDIKNYNELKRLMEQLKIN